MRDKNIRIRFERNVGYHSWPDSTEMRATVDHLTLMITYPRVVERSVTVTDNSPFQDYSHLDDHTTGSIVAFLYCCKTFP